jgi:hypothetical protein
MRSQKGDRPSIQWTQIPAGSQWLDLAWTLRLGVQVWAAEDREIDPDHGCLL